MFLEIRVAAVMRYFAHDNKYKSRTARPKGAADRSRRAFSIIELVIVLLIMGILAAVAMPTFVDSLSFCRVESAARRLKADLELVRQTARLKSASQTITFSGSTYTTSASIKSLDRPQQTYSVNLSDSPFGLTGVTANFASQQSVSFDGYGKPTSGGTILLEANDHQCTVTLNGTTGDVSIASNHPVEGTP